MRIEVHGEKPVDVAVELHVADYTLPNTQDYRTWVDMVECPDTLALEYNVPLWSEKHWEMIGESLRMLGEAGCRVLVMDGPKLVGVVARRDLVKVLAHGK